MRPFAAGSYSGLRLLGRLFTLRCVDNLYAHVAWLPAGPHKEDLRELATTIARMDLEPAWRTWRGLSTRSRGVCE